MGDQITFLTANKGVSGTFGTIHNDFVSTGTLVNGEVVYLPNSVSYIYYDGEFARTNYLSNAVSAGVRVTF